ncbi:hypothetical protein DVQ41_07820 [Yersinia enterocolitica]|nr:hypothetical protein [Yersinia enterocolitica]QBP99360.1 hypothetical protein YEY1_11550 [Yersinia enterocolitica subsp. palearctica]EKN4927086.1 hypothetical protein [Yersinia enterocolitica]EKN5013420.1 hypothetical protein [Yersinia enterocolitica]EKN5057078.1 hypothetical protein [Yersinia enterocolitica]
MPTKYPQKNQSVRVGFFVCGIWLVWLWCGYGVTMVWLWCETQEKNSGNIWLLRLNTSIQC